MASLIQSAKVDWDFVDEELDRVPEEFKDPRFDSLRHVLDILSAVDAEAALEEVCLKRHAPNQRLACFRHLCSLVSQLEQLAFGSNGRTIIRSNYDATFAQKS